MILTLSLTAQKKSTEGIISILDARSLGTGSTGSGVTVTVKGISLNGPELGSSRYIQDNTGGIAVYDASVSNINRGDEITVTGALNNYNALMEITSKTANPGFSYTINSSGNKLPEPVVITPDQESDDYESMLITIKDATFSMSDQGKTFDLGGTSGKNYTLTANGKSFDIRINSGTNIVGQVIPSGKVKITGVLGQYVYGGTDLSTTGYQLVPRDMDDLQNSSSIFMTSNINVSNINTAGFDLTWKTNISGSTQLLYGHTTGYELGVLSGSSDSVHNIHVSGNVSDLFYVRPFSVNGTDTASFAMSSYITKSNSTGNISVYFNNPVNNSFSKGVNAVYVNNTIEDTLVKYINKAKSTIDIAIYNFNNDGLNANISTALNTAATNGVDVRVIYCGTTSNSGINGLSANVHTLSGPDANHRNGIMHNKFMIIDANSANAKDPIVWTGSVNWTQGNMHTDANDIIVIQDQSLAKVYTVEFDEMWGSYGLTPNSANAKFGSAKKDNTPHELIIGNRRVECYFSPSDGVNNKIQATIKTANSDIEGAVMLVTRKELSYAISDAVTAGASAMFMVDTYDECLLKYPNDNPPSIDSTVVKTLKKACGVNFKEYPSTMGGILHNKYMIVDYSNSKSDPLVLTGSHNWSAAANTDNDENTIIVHDSVIANIYFQNFAKLNNLNDTFHVNGIASYKTNNSTFNIYPNPTNGNFHIQFYSEKTNLSSCQIFDLTGKLIFSEAINVFQGNNNVEINTQLKPGLYFVKLYRNDNQLMSKILIH